MHKKILVIILSLISVICLAFGVTACGDSESNTSTGGEQSSSTDEGGTATTTKQTPVYQGMVISSADSTSTTSAKVASVALTANGFAGSEYYDDYGNYYDGNGGYFDVYGVYHEGEYHPYHGDYDGKDNGIDYDQPYDDDTPTIEQEIETTLQVTGAGQSIYYADKGDDIYITIKLYNPDYFDIISFVLSYGSSEIHYSSYMFESGSDYNNIIIKLNVGTAGGIIEYAISEIKYIDTDVKNVLMDGDTVVKCGVRADDQTYATVSDETHDLDSISFDVKIVDLYSLIEYSDGYTMAVLYDGDSLIQTVDLEIGTNTVQFTNLTPNTLYQYAVVALYDDLSGTGTALNYLYKNAVYTDTIVLFDTISVGQKSITFGYSWYEGYPAATITQLTLTTSGKSQTLENSATSVTGLLSNTEYILTAYYTNLDSETESITLTFTTTAKAAPSVEISTLTSGQESVEYALAITDTDSVGSLKSVTLSLGDNVYTETSATGTFENLLSNNTYTITAVYTYDLNDGKGEQTATVTKNITTNAKATPTADIEHTDSSTTGLTFELTFTDKDSVGEITAIGLYNGDSLVASISDLTLTTLEFTGLESYTQHTLVVDYKYNLNDGKGVKEECESLSAYTNPVIEFEALSVINTSAVSEGQTIIIQATMNNPNEATFVSVVVNGETYSVSTVSTSTKLRAEIVNNGQFEGGDTELTITQIICTLGGNTYTVDISSGNTASVFINGELTVEDFTIVRVNDSGEYEETYYGFYSEQLYYQITLSNATCYNVDSITIGSTTYDSSSITMSSDCQTVYISISNFHYGWQTYTLSSISYSNSTFEKTKPIDLTVAYMRLSSDDIVEISTADQLLDVDDCKYYKLVNNIDLSGYEWANKGNIMYGVFDGNDYTISNMSAVTTYSDTDLYLGLFKEIDGVIANLNIIDALYMIIFNSTTGNSYSVYAGGIGAKSITMMAYNVTMDLSISVTLNGVAGDNYIGGLVGYCSSGAYIKDIDIDAVIDFSTTSAAQIYSGGLFGYLNDYSWNGIYNVNISLATRIDTTGSTYYADSVFVGGVIGYLFSSYGINILNVNATLKIVSASTYTIFGEVVGNLFELTNCRLGLYNIITDLTLTVESGSVTYNNQYCYIGNIDFQVSVTGYVIYIDETCNGSATIINNSNDIIYYYNNGFKFSYSNGAYTLTGYYGNDTDIVLPDSIYGNTYIIGSSAFSEYTSLTSIVIPDSVTSIGDYAFTGCTSLTTVYYNGTADEWNAITFADSYSNPTYYGATLYYYSESEPDYSDGNNYWHYIEGEIVVWTKAK